MGKAGKIRALVLGLIRNGDRILVEEGFDTVKQQAFYRALGGGVDFGETSLDALQREFREEIQAELTNIRYLGCLENIFVLDGQPGHELIQLYECDFSDAKFYQIEKFTIVEKTHQSSAFWVEISRFKSGELRLVPEQFFEYLS